MLSTYSKASAGHFIYRCGSGAHEKAARKENDNAGALSRVSNNLLDKVAAGEQGAVQDFLDTYGGLIYSLARRFMLNSADVDDAVQEIFINLWKNAGRYDASLSAEKTFVTMIARRTLIDIYRRNKRQVDTAEMPEHFEVSDDNHHHAEHVADAAVAAEVLKELKPDQGKVLKLSIHFGMSHGEISEATNIPIGTVKSHIRRGLAFIRRRLTAAEGGPA